MDRCTHLVTSCVYVPHHLIIAGAREAPSLLIYDGPLGSCLEAETAKTPTTPRHAPRGRRLRSEQACIRERRAPCRACHRVCASRCTLNARRVEGTRVLTFSCAKHDDTFVPTTETRRTIRVGDVVQFQRVPLSRAFRASREDSHAHLAPHAHHTQPRARHAHHRMPRESTPPTRGWSVRTGARSNGRSSAFDCPPRRCLVDRCGRSWLRPVFEAQAL